MVLTLFSILSTLSILSFNVQAGEKSSPSNHPYLYGEKNFENWFGPSEPFFSKDERLGRIMFENQKRRENFVYNFFEREALFMEEWFKDLHTGSNCPNRELAEHFDYIRYLHRLAALSYLHEHLSHMEDVSRKMKFKGVCELNMEELLKTCSPSGEDMKLFVQSSKVLSKNFPREVTPFDFPFEKTFKDWIRNFKEKKLDSVSKKRMSSYCQESDCLNLDKDKLEKAFGSVCERDKKTFLKICSERDSLFGLSSLTEPYHVLASSDALSVINKEGNGQGCLARFSRQMKEREARDPVLEKIFSAVYEDRKEKQKKDRTAELAGRLFPAGSLRRFMESGLTKIFIEKAPSQKTGKKIEAPKKELVLTPLAPEPLKRVFIPKPKLPGKIKESASAPPPKTIAPEKTYFLKTVEVRREYQLESMKLDMLKFKYDYVFNSKMLEYLDEKMVRFTSRKGLEEMKEFDSLGGEKGPVPLLFVKYLIDKNHHQGLFNLVETIGEDFFVKNNMDPAPLSQPFNFIKLKFEENSDHPWQIYLLKEP